MFLKKISKLTLFVTVFVLLVSGAASYSLIDYLTTQRAKQLQLQLSDQATSHARAIEQELSRASNAAYAIAGWLTLQQGDSSQFSEYAANIFPYYPHLSSISLAPNGIVSQIYPLHDKEHLLGYDIFADTQQGSDAKIAAENKHLQLTGPYQLVQGGTGIVGRLPINVLQPNNSSHFWGFVNVVFHLNKLESLQSLYSLNALKVNFTLRQQLQNGQLGKIISSTGQTVPEHAVHATILPQSANWSLSLYPQDHKQGAFIYYQQAALALIFTALMTIVSFLLMQSLYRKHQLTKLVTLKTQDLQTQLERHRSFIAASNTGSWEYDQNTGQLSCSPEYLSMLGYEPEELTEKDCNLEQLWTELLHPADKAAATQVFADYLKRHDHSLYENQFRLRHKDGHWVWILSRGRSINSNGQQRFMVGTHIDITARKQSELNTQLLARLFEQSSEGLLITNAAQEIVQVNKAFCEISGYQRAEVIGKDPRLLNSGRHDKNFYRAMWQAIDRQGSWKGEIWNRRKDGSIFPEWLSISKIENPDTAETFYIGLFRDISQYKEDEEQIRFLAQFDPLTKLPNRSLLLERTEQAIAHAKLTQNSLAMLFIDVDRFKQINDSLGHQIGDQLLIKIAHRLTNLCQEEDTLCRLNSDEFVLLQLSADIEKATTLAERILPAMLKPYKVAGHELVLSVSVGIALYPQDGHTFHEVYKHADIAMYRAKQLGRNTYCFFTTNMQEYHARHLLLENALRRAIEHGELSLVYQPQYSLTTHTLTGFEALLRWQHPELGFISPAEFIPLAETSGLMLPLGEWVISTALTQLATWQQHGYNHLVLAINLSPLQFRQPDLLPLLQEQLHKLHIPATNIELEITESAMMDDPVQAEALIEQFHRIGINVAIDDFGTGYSSLSYLKRFALNKLKIDQSFIRDILDDADDRAIVNAIINMAKSLELKTIAEGVETAAQQQLLQEMGCDDIQGYFYSKPLTVDDATLFIKQHGAHQH